MFLLPVSRLYPAPGWPKVRPILAEKTESGPSELERSKPLKGVTDEGSGIGVARIFDWGGPKPQITYNDVIRNFQKRNFLLGKDIVEWKI